MHVIPGGFRSYWGDDLHRRRYIETRFREIFSSMGFREVETPSVEIAEVFEKVYPEERLFFVEDRLEGQRLALRYDHTLPIVRNYISGGLGPRSDRAEFFYIGKVFRNVSFSGGSFREFTQAGVEMFGYPEPEGERRITEVLVKIIEFLREAGINTGSFVFVLGDAQFFNSLVAHVSEVLSIHREAVVSALEKRDVHLFPQEVVPLLKKVYSTEDGLDNLFDRASFLKDIEEIAARVRSLSEIFSAIPHVRVVFDPGFFVNTNFYSGVVFSMNHTSLSFPVLSGGRYDPFTESLLKSAEREEASLPSIGFAFGLERLSALISSKL